jgi:nucleoside-diphosphate-sugar epimerase
VSLRVLVTGGAGLLGGPITRALLLAGHDVCVLSRGERAVPAGAEACVADRADEASLSGALTGREFDAVVDLLAFDAAGVERLLAIPGFRARRLFLVSSGQVYLVAAEPRPPFAEPDAERPPMPEPVPETRAHRNWVYGIGKREAERALRERAAELGIAATVLRLPVVQGANDSSRRLWAYLQRMLDGGPILLPGGGAYPVRFVWTEDVARAVVALAGQPPPPAFAYNLAQPDEPALSDFLVSAADVLGAEPDQLECTWEQAAAAGLDEGFSPFSGPWCSRPDAALATRDWGFEGTPSDVWLPEVVRAHLAEPAPEPHFAYEGRDRELALAADLDRGRSG